MYATFLCITLGTPLLVCLAYRFSSKFRKWFRGNGEQILTGMYLGGIYSIWNNCTVVDLADTVSTCANRMLFFFLRSSDGRSSSLRLGNRTGTGNGELPQTHLLFILKGHGPQVFHFYPIAHLYERPIPSNFFLDLRISIFKCDWMSSPTQ